MGVALGDFEVLAGQGVRCTATISKSGRTHAIAVGNRALLKAELRTDWPNRAVEVAASMEQQGRVVVFVAVDGTLQCVFALAAVLRDSALATVQALHRRNVGVTMLTGDSQRTALVVAKQLGLAPENVIAEATPSSKVEAVARLQSNGHVVAMVGDGINDAPALAQADLGVAVGAGTDVAMGAADVVLVRSDLLTLCTALDISRTTIRRIHLNLVLSFLYNIISIPAAAGVYYPITHLALPPYLAGLAMALSSVCVVGSSLTINFFRPEQAPNLHATSARATNDSERDVEMRAALV